MKNYLSLKYSTVILKKYIFISIISIIILFTLSTKNFANENVFTIEKVEVQGPININFSREKYFNRAFANSFEILMNKILLTRDLKKVKGIRLKQIKNLISSFRIIEESYKENAYRADITILYNENKKYHSI